MVTRSSRYCSIRGVVFWNTEIPYEVNVVLDRLGAICRVLVGAPSVRENLGLIVLVHRGWQDPQPTINKKMNKTRNREN